MPSAMSIPVRLAPRLRPLFSATTSRAFASTVPRQTAEEWLQRSPLGPYYEQILNNPSLIPQEKPEDPPNTADPEVLPPEKKKKKKKQQPADSTTTTAQPQTPEERVKIIFGSRLLGPIEQADRLAARKAKSTLIAGVLVPPKPEEPDNCCMSGCVNCVWDRFRDEMEEWSLKNSEAQAALRKVKGSMDSDGGGSESNWTAPTPAPAVGDTKIAKDFWDEGLYESVPVGIREFMKQEKRLKERHAREGTVGG